MAMSVRPRAGWTHWEDLRQRLESVPEVQAAAPWVELEGMIRAGRDLKPVIVNGIDPEF